MRMAMPELGHILFTFLGVLTLTILVDGKNQLGFISLDCGLSANSTYTDDKTTLNYVSDASFIDAGVGKAISPGYNTGALARQLWYVRTFPTGDRNCYNIPVTINTKYLIRTTFYYGNYDGLNRQPTFDLYLGVNKWVTVEIVDVTCTLTKEIIYTATMNYTYVCLVNTGNGTPFLSSLELRPLHNNTYDAPAGALALYVRWDIGSISSDIVRYPHDAYDRIWVPDHSDLWTDISTNLTIDAQVHNDYQPPSLVMRSASTPKNDCEPMILSIEPQDSTLEFYVFMHFAEIGPNQTRIFNISENKKTWYGPLSPDYLSTTTIFSNHPLTGDGGRYEFSLFKVDGSTLPPIQNAIEYYYPVNLDQLRTDQADVDAITNVKSTYGIRRNWQGDPCAPKNYSWDGLNCRYPHAAEPIITGLNLSSSGLVGLISPDIGNLQSLESLDLYNNNFTGSVPSFLSSLTSLKVLNLSGNNLTGSVPGDLCQRSQNHLLHLSVSGNPYLLPSDSCTPSKVEKKKKTTIVAPVVASIAGVLVQSIALATAIICLRKRKKSSVSLGGNVEVISGRPHEPLDAKKRQFTYSELRRMTNNFNYVLGKGGFGTVYHGYLGGTPVAVKMLSESSLQGFKEFQAEVKLLLRVHHKNLTTLVGYCDEGPNLGLIYEYMANGNLKDHLSEKNSNTLSMEGRLQVAVEAAQGLEYLHNGCKPPIVHRDVKTANILLNDKFQAKLSDFGLSRVFPTESGTHVSTTFAGTPGYFDPECYLTGWLTEKSDVFSFGVVLLEIITARSVIDRTKQYGHISQWVSSLVEKGNINQVVDPRLHGEFDINSIWKVVELALSCLSTASERRPTMSQAVTELNEALVIEMARTQEGFSTQSRESIDTFQAHSPILPAAR